MLEICHFFELFDVAYGKKNPLALIWGNKISREASILACVRNWIWDYIVSSLNSGVGEQYHKNDKAESFSTVKCENVYLNNVHVYNVQLKWLSCWISSSSSVVPSLLQHSISILNSKRKYADYFHVCIFSSVNFPMKTNRHSRAMNLCIMLWM